jgi:hypothetical protein
MQQFQCRNHGHQGVLKRV